ncbi:MAG: hypothetical protein FJ026_05175 [Chloroflexi bacterium]|nr:hypothetical protein [Chloroflexota bacterium]
MWKNRVVVILTGILALALVVGSVYIMLRPETAHAQGRRFGNGGSTAVTDEHVCSCGHDEGDIAAQPSQGYGRRMALQQTCEATCGGHQEGGLEDSCDGNCGSDRGNGFPSGGRRGVGIRRLAGAGQAR